MPRNGSGTFNLITNSWYPSANGVIATSTDWNTFISDIASGLTQSVSNDGQTPMIGNLQMATNKITGLGAGSANTDAVNFGQIVQTFGQCRLVKSGANIVLQPFDGNRLFINGSIFTIPAAGVSLSAAGLTPGTFYYIYAAGSGSSVSSLEASTTASSADATYGNQVKTGDSSRVLVGAASPIAGPAWQDAINQRFVISWFNRRPILSQAGLGATTTTTSSSLVELSTGLRCEFLMWSDDSFYFGFDGYASNNTLAASVINSISLDGMLLDSYSAGTNTVANQIIPVSVGCAISSSTGYHYATPLAAVSTGTGSWIGSNFAASRCSIKGIIRG